MKLKAICMAALLLVGSDAAAQSTTNGTISPSDATMTVVQISGNTCGVQSGIPVHYETVAFSPAVSAMHTLSLTSSSGLIGFYLYQFAFNPATGGSNCIAASGVGGAVAKPLTAGTIYIVVAFNNSGDQSGTANYALKISAPREKAVEFGNDLRSDLAVVRNAGGGQVSWWVSDSLTSGISHFTWGTSTDIFLPGDYDGDGKADVAIWRSGPVGTAGFWIRHSHDGSAVFYPFGEPGDDPLVVGDYDGDGRTDIAIYRPGKTAGAPSVWYYQRSIDGAVVGVVWGQNGDYAVPGDFDGDGKNDFVVQRNAGGGQAVFILNQTTAGVSTTMFGTPTDVVVPGDYDGDGKTDIMIVRGSFGALQWWGKRSSNGSVISQTFGVPATDYATQGDYDGDGKTDIAIWRPDLAGARFWISQSGGGVVTRLWGQNGDYPVANWNSH